MSVEPNSEVVAQLNKDLKSSLKSRGYEDVKVFVLYWQEGHEGYKKEGQSVCRMFEDVFHYPVCEFPIPTTNSLIQLSQFVLQEIPKNPERHSLCIIHYGGHGDPDNKQGQERRSVWAALEEGGPILEWYKIQDLLRNLDTDVLLLLDCCFASQSARHRDEGRGGLEVLAAAAMGVETPPPGDTSFTSIFLQEVQKTIAFEGSVKIKDLHGQLSKRQQELCATPVHFSLKKGRLSIVLKPLLISTVEEDVRDEKAQSFLQLLVRVEEELTSHHADQINHWLRTNIPYIVSGLEVIDKAKHIQSAIMDIEKGQKSFVKCANIVSKTQIVDAWKGVVAMVENYLAANPGQQPVGEEAKSVRVGELLKQLDAKNSSVVDLIEQTIVTTAGEALDEAIEDDTVYALGLTGQLRLRKLVKTHRPLESTANFDADESTGGGGEHEGSQRVIQEYKVYGEYIDPREMPAMNERVYMLFQLLREPKSTAFRALRCVGLCHEDLERKYTLTFEIPEEYDTSEYVTLDWILQNTKGRQRPSLNQRLWISLLLARAIYKWHLVGWLHQGISSPNIIFFRTGGKRKAIDYARPYLHGFDFARPDSDPSMGRAADDDAALNIYRHPERQGPAQKGYQRRHDFYSLGVVMLEIGLWQCAPTLVRKVLTPTEIQKELQKNCTDRLAHFAGDSYQAAVGACLSGQFGVELDDASGTQLLKAFQAKVVNELSKGVRL